MRKLALLTIIFLCAFAAFGQSKKARKPVKRKSVTIQPEQQEKTVKLATLTDEEYTVLMTILGQDSENFVVSDTIITDEVTVESVASFKDRLPDLNDDTFEDYIAKRKESARIEKRFPTKKKYTLITMQELGRFFYQSSGWEGFYKKYPKSGGYFSFSRVGFSKDGKQAFVSSGHVCGGLCGEGHIYLLSKENGEWKIVKEQSTWIS